MWKGACLFFFFFLKVQTDLSGCLKGWSGIVKMADGSDPEKLIPPLKCLKITPPVVVPQSRGTRRAHNPTWGYIKHLTSEGQGMVLCQCLPVTPDQLFVAMLALLTVQVSIVKGENYWTYYLNPPVLHPVTWEDVSVPVFVNNI